MNAWLPRVQHGITRIEEIIMALLLGAMILLAGSQIILRNLFDSGLVWADPVLRIMVLWIALFGALAATRDHRHLRIDLVSHTLSEKNQALLAKLHDLFSGIVCLTIGWHAARFVYVEWQEGSTLFSNVPAWMGEIIIPVGFTLMGLKFLLNIPLKTLRDESP
ncbi:MAG: TRAP transporter small permease [Candidatus Thiodiazotropha sp.]